MGDHCLPPNPYASVADLTLDSDPVTQSNQNIGAPASASSDVPDVPPQPAVPSSSSYQATNFSGKMTNRDAFNTITNNFYLSDASDTLNKRANGQDRLSGPEEDGGRSQSDDGLEHPQDAGNGDSSLPGISFAFNAKIYNSTSSEPFQELKINGRLVVKTTRGQSEPKRLLSSSLIKFTKLNFQATGKSPGVAYKQVYARVKIDVKHKYTDIESRKRHPKFDEECPDDGVVSWEFYVDGANERQIGIGFEDPASVIFKFHGMSDDEPPPLPPHFDIEVTSYWSLTSPRQPHADYSTNLGWPFLPASEAPRHSTLCQVIKLEVPSELSQDTLHMSAAKVTQSGCQIIIKREGSCTVTPVVFPA